LFARATHLLGLSHRGSPEKMRVTKFLKRGSLRSGSRR
jgi:hypothetical protein